MRFEGRHGVPERERATPQPIQVDVELSLDLSAAGRSDDLSQTVDYSAVFQACRRVVEGSSRRLIEAIAEAIAAELLADFPIGEVRVRVRKPRVGLPGTLDYAGVEITRTAR